MEELVGHFAGIALLCRRYRHQVLCVHQESNTDAFRSTYERGRVRPLLRGAASVVVLAYLPAHNIKRLYEQMAPDFAEAGLGETLADVKAALKAHRQRGWVMTVGEVTAGVVGIAAPVFDARQEVLGSLSLTVPANLCFARAHQSIAEQVTLCARIITKAMTQL